MFIRMNKKYMIITGILCVAVLLSVYGVCKVKKDKQINMYRCQSIIFPRTNDALYMDQYFDYSVIDENELYIAISAYNWYEDEDLTLESIKDYLSEEYNEDGTLRVETGWKEIYEFQEWVQDYGKRRGIGEYRSQLAIASKEYGEKKNRPYQWVYELSLGQLKELAKKVENRDYEINEKIMGY